MHCFRYIVTPINKNNHFLNEIQNLKFFLIFEFLVRGYIMIFCEKLIKFKIFNFGHTWIGNFFTSKTRYDI